MIVVPLVFHSSRGGVELRFPVLPIFRGTDAVGLHAEMSQRGELARHSTQQKLLERFTSHGFERLYAESFFHPSYLPILGLQSPSTLNVLQEQASGAYVIDIVSIRSFDHCIILSSIAMFRPGHMPYFVRSCPPGLRLIRMHSSSLSRSLCDPARRAHNTQF